MYDLILIWIWFLKLGTLYSKNWSRVSDRSINMDFIMNRIKYTRAGAVFTVAAIVATALEFVKTFNAHSVGRMTECKAIEFACVKLDMHFFLWLYSMPSKSDHVCNVSHGSVLAFQLKHQCTGTHFHHISMWNFIYRARAHGAAISIFWWLSLNTIQNNNNWNWLNKYANNSYNKNDI